MDFEFTKGYEDYAKFPMHYLRITQSYNAGNHKAHWDGANYKDYPIDLGGMDSGRDYLFAPVDMKIVALKGIGNSMVSNKIFLQSINPVKTPACGTTKIFMTAVHFEDSDVKRFNLKVGKIVKAGEAICLEGKETATANHLHLTCGIGNATESIKNNKGKRVTKGMCKKPEDIFYIDNSFTIIKNTAGLSFKTLPMLAMNNDKIGSPIPRNKRVNQIEIIVNNLRVREQPSISAKTLGYINPGIYDYIAIKQADNYTWYNVGIGWLAFNSAWCKLYLKEEPKEPTKEQSKEPPKEQMDSSIVDNGQSTKEESPIEKKSLKDNIFTSFFKKISSFVKIISSFIIKIFKK